MIKEIFTSFLRNIGKILAYILVGAIIALLVSKTHLLHVSAASELSYNGTFKISNVVVKTQKSVWVGANVGLKLYIAPSAYGATVCTGCDFVNEFIVASGTYLWEDFETVKSKTGSSGNTTWTIRQLPYRQQIPGTTYTGPSYKITVRWTSMDVLDSELANGEWIGEAYDNPITINLGKTSTYQFTFGLISATATHADKYESNNDEIIIDQNQQVIDKTEEIAEDTKGILATIRSVLSGITNLPGLIWNAIKGGFDAITSGLTNLGNKIGGFFDSLLTGILDGIKALFVPTQEQLEEIIEKSKELTENFGFIGESFNFFINIFTSFLGMVNQDGCAIMPEFTIGATTLFDSVTFWEEQTVCLSDNPVISSNITTIRAITSIALVCMFISFAAANFFNILSKNGTVESATYDESSGYLFTTYTKVENGKRTSVRSKI